MEIVGARLGRKCHHTSAGVAVFRLEAIAVHREFRDGLEGRGVRRNPAHLQRARRIRGDTIKGGGITCGLPTAQDEPGVTADVLGLRRERGQIEGAAQRTAYHQRQLIHHLISDRGTDLGIFGLQLHGGGLYFHGLLCGHLRRPEAIFFHPDVVKPNGETGNCVVACVVRDGVGGDIGGSIHHGDLNARDHCARRIVHRSGNRSPLRLGEQQRDLQQNQDEKRTKPGRKNAFDDHTTPLSISPTCGGETPQDL